MVSMIKYLNQELRQNIILCFKKKGGPLRIMMGG